VCRLFRFDRLSITNPFSRFPVLRFPVPQFCADFPDLRFQLPPDGRRGGSQHCLVIPSMGGELSKYPGLDYRIIFYNLLVVIHRQ